MNEPMRCGCRITPGGPIGYGELRTHILEHIPNSFLNTTSTIFMLELLSGLNGAKVSDETQKFYLETFVPFRMRLMGLASEYDEKIKPGLEKIWPKNPIAEALL